MEIFDEQAFIQLCKSEIEKKFFINSGSYSQRDLENLNRIIEDKSGVIISLSTLKRLWKNDFKQTPQAATLNALASLLDYDDWYDFKVKNQPFKELSREKSERSYSAILWIGITLAVVIVSVVLLSFPWDQVKVNGPIHFSTQKTVLKGIPSTVIFKYDVSNVVADNFYIQQSWNESHREPIDPKGDTHTSIYYASGYHRAKLYADDSLIALQPIHILSDGWEPHIYVDYKDEKPIHFKNENFIVGGNLHLGKDLLSKEGIDLKSDFSTRVSHLKEFGISSDNFSLFSRVKVDSLANKLCPWMTIFIVCENQNIWARFVNKGCEHNASFKIGKQLYAGKKNDFSKLGINVYEWQNIGFIVENKEAKITIDDEIVIQQSYVEDIGHIVGLLYIFDGTGSLDYVQLSDINGNAVFEDDFDLLNVEEIQ